MKKTFVVVALILFCAGCFGPKKEKAAITIDSIEVSAPEFERSYESSQFAQLGMSKSDYLDTFIARKLMLKEAEHFGLDKDQEFLSDIQLFWEQSLLKRVLLKKQKELSLKVAVSDSQVQDFYNKYKDQEFSGKELSQVRGQIKRLLMVEQQQVAIQDWADSLKKKAAISIDYKELGIPQEK